MSLPSINRYISFSNFNQKSFVNSVKLFTVAVSVMYAVMSIFYTSFWMSLSTIATTTHILCTMLTKDVHPIKIGGIATFMLASPILSWITKCSTQEFFQVFLGTNITIILLHLEVLFFESEIGRQFLADLIEGVD